MNRLSGLDALRGIAASLVLVAHILGQLRTDGHAWARMALEAFDLGTFGVVLFFLISGFVIPFSLSRGLLVFGISRAARLLPALWLSIAFCLALGTPLQSGTQLVANAFMVAPVLGEERFSGPYWTLSWELGFYGIVGLVFALGQARSPRTFGLLSVAAVFGALFSAWTAYLCFMYIGALLRMVLLDRNEAAKLWLFVAICSLAGLLSLWVHVVERGFLIALLLPIPLFVLTWNRLSHPALLWLGAISYSLYLFNLPLIETLATVGMPLLIFIAASVGLSVLLAALVYRWVETPTIAWGRTVSASLAEPIRDIHETRRASGDTARA